MGELFGFEALSEVHDLQIDQFETYSKDRDSADKRAFFSFEIDGCKIHCRIGQEVKESKKITFYSAREKEFQLVKGATYDKIFSSFSKSDSMLLTLDEAACVNHLLERIIAKEHAKHSIAIIQEKTGDDAIEILQDLNNKFLHRHQFYWSSFYKLFFYHLVLIALPAIVYYYLIKADTSINMLSTIVVYGVLSSSIFLFIWFYSLKKTDKYLDDEEHRMKLVLERIREIYCAKYGVNLYPGDKRLLSCEEIFEKFEMNKFSSQNKGIGSDYMFNNFERTCRIGSLLSFLYFIWLVFWYFVNKSTG